MSHTFATQLKIRYIYIVMILTQLYNDGGTIEAAQHKENVLCSNGIPTPKCCLILILTHFITAYSYDVYILHA